MIAKSHWESFIEAGFPARFDERWKYADLSWLQKQSFAPATLFSNDHHLEQQIQPYKLNHTKVIFLVLVNGYYSPTLSDLSFLPKEVSVRDGLDIHIADGHQLDHPIHLLSVNTVNEPTISKPRYRIRMGKSSQLTLIEEHLSLSDQAYLSDIAMNVQVGAQAKLSYYKIQREQLNAIHLANTIVTQQKESIVNLNYFSCGAQFARDDVQVHLSEAGAECQTAGLYQLNHDNQYVDYHIDINHVAAFTRSEMLYKGILENKSRAVFNGRLHVEKNAKKIVAHQANHHLLLSNDAEAYAKPELEIYADDVKCKHGATTGQLDEDALFYLRSRGMEKTEAVNVLLQGFANEVIQRIDEPNIKAHIEKRMRHDE